MSEIGQLLVQLVSAFGGLFTGIAALLQARPLFAASSRSERPLDDEEGNHVQMDGDIIKIKRRTAGLALVTVALFTAAVIIWAHSGSSSANSAVPPSTMPSSVAPSPTPFPSISPTPERSVPSQPPIPSTPQPNSTIASPYFNEFSVWITVGNAYDLDIKPGDDPLTNFGSSPDPTYQYRDLYFEQSHMQLQGTQQPIRGENYTALVKVGDSDSPTRCKSLSQTKNGNVSVGSLTKGSKICVYTWENRWAFVEIKTISDDRKSIEILVKTLK